MGVFERFAAVVVTCEHGGNAIPGPYRRLFAGQGAVLASHRGWDEGALTVARAMAKSLRAPLHYSTVSRLLVDLNRSERHPKVFSSFTSGLAPDEKERVKARYYRPHRDAVEAELRRLARKGRVLHLAVHSFTPELNGEVRNAELGLLYDPKRRLERELCEEMARRLRDEAPELRVRRNYPYVGYSDGFTTYLRKQLGAGVYAGIEIEINQTQARGAASLARVARALLEALRTGRGAS